MRNILFAVFVTFVYVALSACDGSSGEDVAFSECNEFAASELFNKVYEKAKVSDVLTDDEIKVAECAAGLGNAKAQLFVGYGNLSGKFFDKDERLAYKRIMSASSGGNYEAAIFLFSMHLVGQGGDSLHLFPDILEVQRKMNNFAADYVVATSYCLGFYKYAHDESKCDSMRADIKNRIDKDSGGRLAAAIRSSKLEESIRTYLFVKYTKK